MSPDQVECVAQCGCVASSTQPIPGRAVADVRRLSGVASRGGGFGTSLAGRHSGRGFTLIEVLLATTLLAAGLALAFATLRAATATASRGDAIAQRSERMRAVEGFLRSRLTGMRAVGFGLDDNSGLAQRFVGDARQMRFVADLPDYLGHGGPYLHTLTIERDGQQYKLTVDLTVVQGGEPVPAARPRPPELLVDGLGAARFRYRTLDENNRPGQWQAQWPNTETLPLQIEIDLRDADGRAWPPLLVAPPLAGSYSGPAGVNQ